MIVRVPFTAHDEETFPQCNNSNYLEYETVKTGLSTEKIPFGYKEFLAGNKFRWVRKDEVNICMYCKHTPPNCPASEIAGIYFHCALVCKFFVPMLSIVKTYLNKEAADGRGNG